MENNNLFRKDNAKMHIFGKITNEKFSINDLNYLEKKVFMDTFIILIKESLNNENDKINLNIEDTGGFWLYLDNLFEEIKKNNGDINEQINNKKILLYGETKENLKAEFPNGYILLENFFNIYILEKCIEKIINLDDDIKIGDLVWHTTDYFYRPFLGFGMIIYDEIKKKKIINYNEGLPPNNYSNQIKILKKNKISYKNIYEKKPLKNFDQWEDFKYHWVNKF